MSAPRLPKKLYRVTRSGGNLRYSSKTGKTFADLAHARAHAIEIRMRDGAEVRIFECEPKWREVPR